MLKVEPIWGNGWWDGEKTVEPPAPFSITLIEGSVQQGFKGVIQEEGPLAGCFILGSPTFVGDLDRLTVKLYKADTVLGTNDTKKLLSGYVQLYDR